MKTKNVFYVFLGYVLGVFGYQLITSQNWEKAALQSLLALWVVIIYMIVKRLSRRQE
jgi:hypothetical protein